MVPIFGPDPDEVNCFWFEMGLWTRFPSLPALMSRSPILSMHERSLISSFLELELLLPADPGRPDWKEDLDMSLTG